MRVHNIFLFLFLTFLFINCSSEDSTELTPSNSAPNILLIIADDLGKDAMPNYSEGIVKPNLPTLEGLMNQGVTFDNFWSYSVCTPTRASILTGKYGVKTNIVAVGDNISTSETSLQNYINNNSNDAYATAIIGKWHLSNNAQDPITMGIDYYAGIVNGGVQSYTNWSLNENGTNTNSTEYVTSKLTDLAIDWVGNQSKPWFLWLAYNAPHTPFHLAPDNLHSQGTLSTDQASIDANPMPYYMSAIEAMDSEIGRFLTGLTNDQLNNTIIIFIGDNGTPNQVAQSPYTSQRVKGSLFEGGINVPMFISGKNVNRFGSRDQSLLGSTDLFATIASVAGVGVSEINNSVNFSDLFSSSSTENDREFIYVDGFRNGNVQGYAIRDSRYKLMVFEDGVERFFDLQDDPYENRNLLNGTLTQEEINSKQRLEDEASRIRN